MTILAEGTVAITQTTIFEVTGTDVLNTITVDIDKITFFNTNALDQTVILYLKKRFQTAKQIGIFELLVNERGEYLEPSENFNIENGDLFQAETTTASAVNFVVEGKRV